MDDHLARRVGLAAQRDAGDARQMLVAGEKDERRRAAVADMGQQLVLRCRPATPRIDMQRHRRPALERQRPRQHDRWRDDEGRAAIGGVGADPGQQRVALGGRDHSGLAPVAELAAFALGARVGEEEGMAGDDALAPQPMRRIGRRRPHPALMPQVHRQGLVFEQLAVPVAVRRLGQRLPVVDDLVVVDQRDDLAAASQQALHAGVVGQALVGKLERRREVSGVEESGRHVDVDLVAAKHRQAERGIGLEPQRELKQRLRRGAGVGQRRYPVGAVSAAVEQPGRELATGEREGRRLVGRGRRCALAMAHHAAIERGRRRAFQRLDQRCRAIVGGIGSRVLVVAADAGDLVVQQQEQRAAGRMARPRQVDLGDPVSGGRRRIERQYRCAQVCRRGCAKRLAVGAGKPPAPVAGDHRQQRRADRAAIGIGVFDRAAQSPVGNARRAGEAGGHAGAAKATHRQACCKKAAMRAKVAPASRPIRLS